MKCKAMFMTPAMLIAGMGILQPRGRPRTLHRNKVGVLHSAFGHDGHQRNDAEGHHPDDD